MSRKVIINLPPDLERHVKDVDGRKLPGLIVEALREKWTPAVETIPEREIIEIVTGPSGVSYPIWGSIPAERKNG